ncbi:MAG: class I SAM-dependent methyltransferase [Dehalococcoidia bacterium]|nr:class I SAM-dependent methyltransferase [Dehalococcoidia bacterium]
MTQNLANRDTTTQFDLAWDDKHAVPPVMNPDLAFLFQRMNEVTVEEVEGKEGERILDIGCGRAIDAVELAKSKGECLGVEPSKTMINHARNHITEKGAEVTLIRGIGENLPFKDGSFDKVVCKGALDHFPYPDKAIEEIARVLKPRGKAIIAIANFESLSFRLGRGLFRVIEIVFRKGSGKKRVWHVPDDHAYKFDYASLRKMVEPHFRVERTIGISLFFGFPWWGWLLAKLPQGISLATLNALDRLARRLPSWSDAVLLKCSPREEARAQ